MAVGIDSIMGLISNGGGLALSNTFKVTFQEDSRSNSNAVWNELSRVIPGFVRGELEEDSASGGPARWVSMMCEEATLPGTQFATGQVNGIYTGSGQYNYPHTRLFNDISLTWICDANMTPLKFVNTWMTTIFDDGQYEKILQENSRNVVTRSRNRTVRFNYPDDYTMQLTILKAERNSTSQTGRPSVRYVCEGVFPYAVDSIPLSMGTSQLVKVTANFYYERWYEYYTNQWKNNS